MTTEERAAAMIDSRLWGRMDYVVQEDGGSAPEYGTDEDKLRSMIATAIREAVAEEREACAKAAEAIIACYYEHSDDCACSGVKRPSPDDVAKAIRARP